MKKTGLAEHARQDWAQTKTKEEHDAEKIQEAVYIMTNNINNELIQLI